MYHKCACGSGGSGGGGFALNLGQITSCDITALYDNYGALTASNFIIVPTTNTQMGVEVVTYARTGSISTTENCGSISYNPDTGALVVTKPTLSRTGSVYWSDGQGHTGTIPISGSVDVPYNVWLVVPQTD